MDLAIGRRKVATRLGSGLVHLDLFHPVANSIFIGFPFIKDQLVQISQMGGFFESFAEILCQSWQQPSGCVKTFRVLNRAVRYCFHFFQPGGIEQ